MSYDESIKDMSRTIVPKSDQINADDLISGPITVTIRGVKLTGVAEQPTILDIGDGYRPYKPCKSMGRVLVFCWGKDGNEWIGKSMTLYCDPSVKFAGDATGGIRISHISGIEKTTSVAITVSRGKRKPWVVEPLVIPDYPEAQFKKNLPAWDKAIKSGDYTAQDVINKAQQKGLLTADQKQQIIDCEPKLEPEADATDIGDIPDL